MMGSGEKTMLIIPDLVAHRVSLIQNDYVSGLPSPFAFLGLVENAGRKARAAPWSLGVIPIIHQINESPGRTKGHAVKSGRATKTLEIVEDIRGSVTFSLLIDLGEGDAEIDVLSRTIRQGRLAGGMIVPLSARFSPELIEAEFFRRIKRGRAVLPMRGQATWSGKGSPDGWFDDAHPSDRADKPGWRVPLAVRYDHVEEPATGRSGTRDSRLKHAFSEPVAGVGELVSPRNERLRDDDEVRNLMWRYDQKPGSVAAHHFYQRREEE